MSTNPYTPEELELLKRYPELGPKKLAQMMPGRTVDGIQSKANTLGYSRLRESGWQPWEYKVLRMMADDMEACAARLGRSAEACRKRLARLRKKEKEQAARKRKRGKAAQKQPPAPALVAAADDDLPIVRRIPAGQWRLDHSTACRSVFDLGAA